MSVVIKFGNLFNNVTENAIIAHGCNHQCVMGSGFAKQIRDKFPGAYKLYKEKCLSSLIGDVILYYSKSNNIVVANAITQESYGRSAHRFVSYDAVVTALEEIKSVSKSTGLPLHMPFIGGGLANGNKKILMSIFESIFTNNNHVTIWELEKELD